MNNAENQGTADPAQALPQPDVSGTGEPYYRAATRAGKAHRKKYAPDRAAAEKMLKLYRAALIPRRKRGRHRSDDVTRAIELKNEAKRWPQIAEMLWPRFRQWSRDRQKSKLGCLRDAVGKRLKRDSGQLPRRKRRHDNR